MPMDFEGFEKLKMAAEVHKFRKPWPEETENRYRKSLAEHVRGIDVVESYEIEFGVGWDKWSREQKRIALADDVSYFFRLTQMVE